MILSNPPYIEKAVVETLEARGAVSMSHGMALDGGEDGLDFYRGKITAGRLVCSWIFFKIERADGCFSCEIGLRGQGEAVSALMEQEQLGARLQRCADFFQDLAGP